jgi:3-hydroxyisobutyrate dehydrogenase-like beta-hydroxyacid dehydrogenase
MSDISVIGLGVMGTALAKNLLMNEYSITVWNRSLEKAELLRKEGASVAGTSGDAISASSIIITCVRTHSDTRKILGTAESLQSKQIIELSTGSAPEAESLYKWLLEEGAESLIGMICTFPRGIGEVDSAIVTVGSEKLWNESENILKNLAGKSSYIGDKIGSLAILYSALFLPRQGFMFGMIYGALLCKKAGVSMETYVEQMPLTIKVVHDYYDVFASSVPSNDYSNPQASIDTYVAAFADTLESFKDNGANTELPELMSKLVNIGADAGLGDQQITALINLLDE